MEGIESMSGKFDEIMQRALKRETEKIREESLKKGEAEGLRKGRLEGEMLGLQKGEANGLQRGRSEGRLEGRQEGRQEVVRSMVRDGSIPLSKIAEFSGLTIGEVESIRNSLR